MICLKSVVIRIRAEMPGFLTPDASQVVLYICSNKPKRITPKFGPELAMSLYCHDHRRYEGSKGGPVRSSRNF